MKILVKIIRFYIISLFPFFYDAGYSQLPANQEVNISYHSALEAIENKEYNAAQAYLKKVLEKNAFYQESSGKSAWYLMGLVQEKLQENILAIETMERGLDTLQSNKLNDWYLNYHLARLYAENNGEDQKLKMTNLVYQTLNNITPKYQPDLWAYMFDSFRFFLPDSEKIIAESFPDSSSEAGKVLYRFLRREDTNPISTENELLYSIFQRAAIAREKYRDENTPKGYDLRGDFYVRLGKPWKIYFNHSGVVGDYGYAVQPYEIWFYTQTHPDLFFTFILERGHGNYKIVDGPESIFGDFYNRRLLISKQYNENYTTTQLRIMLYGELAPIYKGFRSRVDRLMEQISEQEALNYARIHFTQEDKEHAAQLDTLLEKIAFNVDKTYEPLILEFNVVKFRTNDLRIKTEFIFGVPNQELFFENQAGKISTNLLGEIGVFDNNYNLLQRDSLKYLYQVQSSEETTLGGFVGKWQIVLDPGRYFLYFSLENPNSKKKVVYRDDFMFSPYARDSLAISDLQLATNIYPSDEISDFVKHSLFVSPVPSNAVQKERPLFLYFELYNLKSDNDGHSKFEIQYSLKKSVGKRSFFKKITGLFRKNKQIKNIILNKISKTGNSDFQVEIPEFDLSAFQEGEYEIITQIKDLCANQTLTTSITFKLVE